MSAPLVSVVMAVHNGARYVRLAIDSVLAQDLTDLELVIVDDGSSDETPAIIASYADARIVYVRNQTNLGQTRSLNVGLARARAEFVARIDADDVYLPGKLSRQYALMQSRSDVAICGTAAIKIDADGNAFGTYVPPTRSDDVRFVLCQRVPVCHVSVIMRRASILAVGGYDERYRYAADYALWSVLAQSVPRSVNLDERLMLYQEFRVARAVHKIGTAGDEGARSCAGTSRRSPASRSRSTTAGPLRCCSFPKANLDNDAIARAYLNLSGVARASTADAGRVQLQPGQLAVLEFAQHTTARRDSDPQGRRRRAGVEKTALRYATSSPTVSAACVLAGVLSVRPGIEHPENEGHRHAGRPAAPAVTTE